jgi:hypothetical protein
MRGKSLSSSVMYPPQPPPITTLLTVDSFGGRKHKHAALAPSDRRRYANQPNLVVDYCHRPGHLRGVLCIRCNAVIGQMGENILHFQRAIDYLKRPSRDPLFQLWAALSRADNPSTRQPFHRSSSMM